MVIDYNLLWVAYVQEMDKKLFRVVFLLRNSRAKNVTVGPTVSRPTQSRLKLCSFPDTALCYSQDLQALLFEILESMQCPRKQKLCHDMFGKKIQEQYKPFALVGHSQWPQEVLRHNSSLFLLTQFFQVRWSSYTTGHVLSGFLVGHSFSFLPPPA